MDEPDDLTVFYVDDSGQNQGPYSAKSMLTWYKTGYFNDGHLMRITDNGQRIGNKVTIVKKLGELKAIYGTEQPIPTSIGEIGFKNFSLKKPSLIRKENVLKPKDSVNVKQEPVVRKEDSREGTSSVKISDQLNKTLPTPRSFKTAGPELPDSMKRGRSRSASSTGSSSYTPKSKRKKSPEKKKVPNSQKQKVALPFYTGDDDKNNQRLELLVALELASFLSQEYVRMNKKAREELHRCYAEFRIPERCTFCDCLLKQPTNFLSHVLSPAHIKKAVDDRRRFTFNGDYLLLKNDMERAKKDFPCKPDEPSTSYSKRQPPPHSPREFSGNSDNKELGGGNTKDRKRDMDGCTQS